VLYGEIEAGGADQITSNPDLTGEEEALLEEAAMEFGTD
jgi:argininosuccinate synthase